MNFHIILQKNGSGVKSKRMVSLASPKL